MADAVIQSSFNVGELAPALYARTDLQKYHSAAALLRNFFVDYRGGASTRPGTRYINRCYKAGRVRLIPFQASQSVDYILEFGDGYIRFINNGAPVLEAAVAAGAANTYAIGDWVYISGTGTPVDGNYYIVIGTGPLRLTDLFGNAVNTPATGTTARIYTLASPYSATDLAQLKFTQDVSSMILCHPNYLPMALKLITALNWTLTPINFGTAIAPPSNLQIAVQGLPVGQVSYSYTVTAVDQDGQESGAALPAQLNHRADIRTNNGSLRLSWKPVPGAKSYNVYKSDVTYFDSTPPGVPYGYIGDTTGSTFDDSNIAPDFSQTPPILQTPILGGGIKDVTVTSPGTYTTLPTATAAPPPAANATRPQLQVTMATQSFAIAPNDGSITFAAGDLVGFANGLLLQVAEADPGNGAILSYDPTPLNLGTFSGAKLPKTLNQSYSNGAGSNAAVVVTWGVSAVAAFTPGTGYAAAPAAPPAITFNPPGATAVAEIDGSVKPSFPTVPAFYQQRLFLGGGTQAPSTFYLSRPGNHYNFNISNPIQADDSINATLVSGQLNTIKGAIATSAGLIVLTDKATWLINGGSAGSAVSPSAVVANPQSGGGASDLPPIVANYDILYVQSKGSVVRDSTYNIYANIYTGTDVSLLSSHLFYGHQLVEWAYAEEPYKIVWAVRDDGVLLSLTFLKEQEFAGWAHSDTPAGVFESVATVVEPTAGANVDAVYFVVNRLVDGKSVRYIERLAERQFDTVADAWCVDCGIRYVGDPRRNFSGAGHLAGLTVTGLADGKVIPPFTVPASGTFTLASPASKVLVGLGFTAQLKTLALDTGEPTVQGKMKKIASVTLRLAQTLGLKIGSSFSTLVLMKDTVVGNVGRMTNAVVTDLVSGDADTYIDPAYTVPGQYCIQQDQPLPATILGVIPKFTVGDNK